MYREAWQYTGLPKVQCYRLQRPLCRRGQEVQKGIAGLQREREALEAGVLEMAGKTVALDRWLAENEAKIPEGATAFHCSW